MTSMLSSCTHAQGRTGSDFDDQNEGLLDQAMKQYPDFISLEMETFHLYDLARCSKGAAGCSGYLGIL